MERPLWFIAAAEYVSTGIEGIGILIILLDGLDSPAGYVRDVLRTSPVGA